MSALASLFFRWLFRIKTYGYFLCFCPHLGEGEPSRPSAGAHDEEQDAAVGVVDKVEQGLLPILGAGASQARKPNAVGLTTTRENKEEGGVRRRPSAIL